MILAMVWENAVPYSKVARDLARRFQFLEQLRERTEGDARKRVPARNIGNALGFDVGTSDAAAQYLVNKGLAKYSATSMPGGLISITHEGIEAVKWTVLHPRESSDHFPAFDIMFIESETQSTAQAIQGTRTKGGPQSLSTLWAKIKGLISS
jgi:hypothetical protein